MDFKRVAAAAAVWLATAAPLAAEIPGAGQAPRPTLAAHTFNYAGVPAGELRKAQAVAEGILREAGIDVAWLDCWRINREPEDASPRCRQPLGATDLILRVGSANDNGRQYVSLGFSLVNAADGRAPYLATVYADLVASVARGARVDAGELLGRAVAHEIGHLLLGTNQHADTGLMRAAWSRAELEHHHMADWEFLPGEADTMRAAVAARMALAATPRIP